MKTLFRFVLLACLTLQLRAAQPWREITMPTVAEAIAWYVNRAGDLLAIGRPAAQVVLFHPTNSLWMSDKESDDVTVKPVTQLMEHQIDFDHINADALAADCALEGGGLKNLSGQIYRAVIVPTSTVIQKGVLERLRAFAAAGGKVVFVGRAPTMVVGRSFLNPEVGTPDLSFATLEPTPEITAKVVAALPPPDVKLDAACPLEIQVRMAPSSEQRGAGGGGRSRGGAGANAGAPPSGAGRTGPAAPVAASGLLGPVRLQAQ